MALTSEQLVFTWGDGRRGQLGHGELETWRSRPEAVESLKASFIYCVKIEISQADRNFILRPNLHQSLNFPLRDFFKYVRT